MLKYDKLRDIETDEKVFDFRCPNCMANGFKKGIFTILPYGVSWKSEIADNSDIKNKMLQKGYDNLLTLPEAILYANNNISDTIGLSIKCNKCGQYVSTREKILSSDLRKWNRKNFEYVMVL